MDIVWLLIPAAAGLLLLRTVMIARKLKRAAANPTLADVRAFRTARRNLSTDRDHLDAAVAAKRDHIEAAKRLSRTRHTRVRAPESRVGWMVEDGAPARRF